MKSYPESGRRVRSGVQIYDCRICENNGIAALDNIWNFKRNRNHLSDDTIGKKYFLQIRFYFDLCMVVKLFIAYGCAILIMQF